MSANYHGLTFGTFVNRAKSDLERKQEQRANHLAQLKQEVTQAERELHGLESEVEQLNSRAAQLEAQAKEARELASNKASYLRDYKCVAYSPSNLVR